MLIISFVFVIFIFFSAWTSKNVEDITVDADERLGKLLSCDKINIKVENGCVDDLDSATKVGVNVDNFGEDVQDLVIRVLNLEGDLGFAEFSASEKIGSPNRILSKNNLLDLDNNVVDAKMVEVYVRVDGNICENSLKIVDVVKC